jgi:hypothetical protein
MASCRRRRREVSRAGSASGPLALTLLVACTSPCFRAHPILIRAEAKPPVAGLPRRAGRRPRRTDSAAPTERFRKRRFAPATTTDAARNDAPATAAGLQDAQVAGSAEGLRGSARREGLRGAPARARLGLAVLGGAAASVVSLKRPYNDGPSPRSSPRMRSTRLRILVVNVQVLLDGLDQLGHAVKDTAGRPSGTLPAFQQSTLFRQHRHRGCLAPHTPERTSGGANCQPISETLG